MEMQKMGKAEDEIENGEGEIVQNGQNGAAI